MRYILLGPAIGSGRHNQSTRRILTDEMNEFLCFYFFIYHFFIVIISLKSSADLYPPWSSTLKSNVS